MCLTLPSGYLQVCCCIVWLVHCQQCWGHAMLQQCSWRCYLQHRHTSRCAPVSCCQQGWHSAQQRLWQSTVWGKGIAWPPYTVPCRAALLCTCCEIDFQCPALSVLSGGYVIIRDTEATVWLVTFCLLSGRPPPGEIILYNHYSPLNFCEDYLSFM